MDAGSRGTSCHPTAPGNMTTYRADYIDDGADLVPANGVIGRGFYFEASSPIAAAMVAALHCRPGEQVEKVTDCSWLDR